ncbi:MAG: cysteine hydrolase [Chloroflexi bacterium]|nr:cysteine hydrolase [Chloroflexota bacterium]
MVDAVIVIDMIRGFLEKGCPLDCGPEARKIIPNVARLLAKERERGSTIIFVCDNHDPDDPEFKMYPPHCIAGTREAEVVPELAAFATEVIPKKTYSAFYNTGLEQRLRELQPEKLIMCGVCTDICVLHSASDARLRGYTVVVPKDCVASFDEEGHRWALRHMERPLGAQVVAVGAV